MLQDMQRKVSFLQTNKVELTTAFVILVLGVGLGLALPEDQSMPHRFNRVITVIRQSCCVIKVWAASKFWFPHDFVYMQISGWLYFFTWSLSFYPQFLLNWCTKSVVGLSLDYVSLNFMGFIGYSIFNVALFFDPGVQEQYRYRSIELWYACLLAVCSLQMVLHINAKTCVSCQNMSTSEYESDGTTHFTHNAGYFEPKKQNYDSIIPAASVLLPHRQESGTDCCVSGLLHP